MEQLESDGLLPRFSLRWFALYFTLSVLFAWVIRQAVIGRLWALAAVFTAALIACFFLIYAVLFLVIWLPSTVARIDNSRKEPLDQSPRAINQGDVH